VVNVVLHVKQDVLSNTVDCGASRPTRSTTCNSFNCNHVNSSKWQFLGC